jgi:polyhydroxyalkanoate synthesis regulator phasin
VAEKKKPSGKRAAKGADSLVGELARRGEVRARDLQKLARTLIDRAERNRTELTRLISKEISRQVKSLGLATREEVDALRRRMRELERTTTGSRSRSAAKKR